MGLKLDNRSSIGAALAPVKANPGPNQYDNSKFGSVKNAAPTYSLRGRYELESKKKVPGPGTYEPKSPEKKRAATHVFGSAS